MNGKFRSWVLSCLLCSGLAVGVEASSVTTVNLEEMVQSANRVFYGRCLSAHAEIDPRSGFPVTVYRFEVLDGLKGVEGQSEVEVRQIGGQMRIPGLPSYTKGQKLMLFLYGDSKIGLTSPVGMAQGVFAPIPLADGRVGWLNGVGNRNLAHDVSEQRAASVGLSGSDLKILQSGDPIPINAFKALVQTIDGRQKRWEVQ